MVIVHKGACSLISAFSFTAKNHQLSLSLQGTLYEHANAVGAQGSHFHQGHANLSGLTCHPEP